VKEFLGRVCRNFDGAMTSEGITISHLEDGLIVEDWSVTDTLGMLRQLGMWRLLIVMLRSLAVSRPR
jgi:hypothetical protein